MNFFGTAPTKSNGRANKDEVTAQAKEWKRNLQKVFHVQLHCDLVNL